MDFSIFLNKNDKRLLQSANMNRVFITLCPMKCLASPSPANSESPDLQIGRGFPSLCLPTFVYPVLSLIVSFYFLFRLFTYMSSK